MKKILLLLLLSATGFSQTLDPTFDTDGIATIQLSNIPSKQVAYDAALQTDGKIVYVGRIYSPYSSNFIARYNVDGTKDNTFNGYGFRLYNTETFQSVQIQNDGKIVVVGLSTVTRVTSTGSLDATFNTTGSKKISFNNQNMNIKAVRFQIDNKIVVSGYISNGTNNDFAVARLNTDGTLDTSFDTDGILVLPISTGADRAFSHKIQTDGKIVVFGQVTNTTTDFAIVRLNTDGSLDTTFGTNGKVVTTFTSTSSEACLDGEILSNGKIVAFGSSGGLCAFARYTTNGTLDTTLDVDGKLTLNHSIEISGGATSTSIHSLPKLKVLADDKLVISLTSNQAFKVIKLFANGSSYDTTFDADGVQSINDNIALSTFLIVKPDGNFITGGYSYPDFLNNGRIKQIEISTNGAIISNTVKNLYLSSDTSPSAFHNTVALSDQSYLVTANMSNSDLVLIKILANGAMDMNFGTSGIINLGTTGGGVVSGKIYLLPNNKIVISNISSLYKMDINGVMDTTFGNSGILNLTSLDSKLNYIDDYTISNDNKILIASDYDYNTIGVDHISTAVVKLNLNGTLDTTFGTNGMVYYGLSGNTVNFYEFPTAIYQDLNNKIIVTSISDNLSDSYNIPIYFSKLNSDGTFDTTFGTNGIYYYSTNTPNESLFVRVICGSTFDNSFLASFNYFNNSNTSYSSSNTLKINPNGGIDTSFGNNGVVSTPLTSSYQHMITQPDGKILKAGKNNDNFSVTRYNSNGSLDTGFGINGEITTPIGLNSTINSIILQPDGKLVATGNSFDGDREFITMARYTDLNLGTLDLATSKNSLIVYPNPIEKEATFQYTLLTNETVSIALVDVQGRVVQNIVTNQNQTAGLQSISISLNDSLTTGNYFLQITSSTGSQAVQIIKK